MSAMFRKEPKRTTHSSTGSVIICYCCCCCLYGHIVTWTKTFYSFLPTAIKKTALAIIHSNPKCVEHIHTKISSVQFSCKTAAVKFNEQNILHLAWLHICWNVVNFALYSNHLANSRKFAFDEWERERENERSTILWWGIVTKGAIKCAKQSQTSVCNKYMSMHVGI